MSDQRSDKGGDNPYKATILLPETGRDLVLVNTGDEVAELLLLQHTCHWYCKSRTVASARMLARHQTPYPQLVASVSPATRQAYLALTRGQ